MMHHIVRFALVATSAALIAGCSAESKKARTLERAAEYYKKGDLEKARIEYQNVLQKFPDDITANERLALIWFDRGATMRALSYLSKMYTLSPGDLNLRLKRAQLIASIGRVAEAKKEATTILERSSAIAEALVLLTETIRDADEYKEAETLLQKFPERNTVSFHLASANMQMLRGDQAAAKTAVQKALSLDPKSAPAHAAMAGLHVAQRNAALALTEYKAAADAATPRGTERLKYAAYLAQTGALPEAIAYLTEITKQVPDFQPAWRSLAQIAIGERRFDDALSIIQSIFTRDPSDFEAQLLRARVWLAKGDTKRAIEDLQKMGEGFPGLGLESQTLASAYLQDGDRPKALLALQQVITQNPRNAEAILLWAQLQQQAGAHQEAATAMAALISRRPDIPQAYTILIEATKNLGKLDDLVRVIKENLAKAPKNAQLMYVLGLVQLQQKNAAEARKSFEQALEIFPDNLAVQAELVSLDLREGKPDSAVQRAQAIITKAPKLAGGHLLMARIQSSQGKWDEAAAAATAALELERNNTAAFAVLADSFMARKAQPGIQQKVDAFLAKRPGETLAALLGGQFFTTTSQFDKARDLYEKHLAAKANDTMILNNLANLYIEQFKQPDRALELARKARTLEPTSPAVADTLGWILYQKKDYKEALPLLEEAAKSLGGNPEVQFHLGMTQRMLGNNEAAAAALRLAVNSPANFAAKEEATRQLAQLPGGAAPAPAKSK